MYHPTTTLAKNKPTKKVFHLHKRRGGLFLIWTVESSDSEVSFANIFLFFCAKQNVAFHKYFLQKIKINVCQYFRENSLMKIFGPIPITSIEGEGGRKCTVHRMCAKLGKKVRSYVYKTKYILFTANIHLKNQSFCTLKFI